MVLKWKSRDGWEKIERSGPKDRCSYVVRKIHSACESSCRRKETGSCCSSSLYLGLAKDPAVLLSLLQRENLSLLLEYLARALKHHLEALLALGSVLLEALNSELLNAVLDLLPATAQRGNLGALGEGGLIGR